MTKPSDVSQDAWNAAREAFSDAPYEPEIRDAAILRASRAIDAAVKAETERCEKIADETATKYAKMPTRSDRDYDIGAGGHAAALEIFRTVRNRSAS